MKKILSLTIACLLLLGLVACANEPTTTVPPVDDTPAVTPDTTPETPDAPVEDEPVVDAPVEDDPVQETPVEEPETNELETMMESIVEGVNIEASMMHEDISDERYWWYFGTETILEGYEAHGYEPMIGSIPLSLCILKVPEGADAATVAADLEETVNPMKWICVEAESKIINQQGNYILIVLAPKDIAEGVNANFNAQFAG